MNRNRVRILEEQDVLDALTLTGAVSAVESALINGFDPSSDPQRGVVDVSAGQLLIMPSRTGTAVGVKIATVAPGNPSSGLPRIQATYLMYDAQTLRLSAVIDGTALTSLRTPAVSIAAVKPALERYHDGDVGVVVFGAGPQARGHVSALRECTPLGIGEVTFVVRSPGRVPDTDLRGDRLMSVEDPALEAAIRQAQVIVCATSARTPLFKSELLRGDVSVVAVGAHESDAREVDSQLVARAQVVVEDVATALREAGDVIMAINEGAIAAGALIPMTQVVRREHVLDPTRPVFFKSSGMSWEDLVVAEAVLDAAHRAGEDAD